MQITIDTSKDSYENARAALAAAFGEPYFHAPDMLRQITIEEVLAQGVRNPAPDSFTDEPSPIPTAPVSENSMVSLPETGTHLTAHSTHNTNQPAGVPEGQTASVSRLPNIPSPPADDPELDIKGVRYDAAIHSEGRTKNKDGTWRVRRNTKGVVTTEVSPVSTAPVNPSVPPPPADDLPEQVTRLHGDLAASVPLPPAQVPLPPAPSIPVPTTFQELMVATTKLMVAGTLTNIRIAEVCKEHGIASLQECFTNTALIPSVYSGIIKTGTV